MHLSTLTRYLLSIWAVFFSAAIWMSQPANAQVVENVRDSFDQSRQLVLISYDVTGLNYKDEVEVTPFIVGDSSLLRSIFETGTRVKGTISFDSSGSYFYYMQSISGDYGVFDRNGKNKLIVWDPFQDGISDFRNTRINLRANVRPIPREIYAGLILQGSNSAPFGAKVVAFNVLGRMGAYLGFRTSGKRPDYRYTVTNLGGIDYLESGVYEIGTRSLISGSALTGGFLFPMARNLHGYAGAGFGSERLFWEYKAYNLDKTLTGTYWALNENVNRKGAVVEAGLNLRLGRFLVEAGASTVAFQSVQITGGIGLKFANFQTSAKQ